MANILHNTVFFIIYVVVMATCLITITVLDVKRIRMIRKHTEAVKENTAVYNKLLDETARDEKTHEQYTEALDSYREVIHRNVEIHKNLMQVLEQTGGQDTWSE